MKRILSALLVSGALLCAMALPAAASEPSAPVPAGQAQDASLPDSVSYYGQIQEIVRDESGNVTRLYLTSTFQGKYIMNILPETVWIDSGNHSAADPADLKAGDSIYVSHSPVSTRSMPPQSNACAVVINIPQDAGTARYHEVEAIARNTDGSLTITSDNGGLLITADASTGLSAYDGAAADPADIQVGDHIMAWYQVVAISYPGQTHASHLMLLPAAGENGQPELPPDGTELSIVLEEDMVLPVSGRVENGTAMVPVAAAARALGYEVTYTPGRNGSGSLVTVESDSFCVRLHTGEKTIVGVTKIDGAVGMTAPTDYGAAPYIAAPGITWASAQLFEMLGRTVTLDGTTLSIR